MVSIKNIRATLCFTKLLFSSENIDAERAELDYIECEYIEAYGFCIFEMENHSEVYLFMMLSIFNILIIALIPMINPLRMLFSITFPSSFDN